VIPRTRLETNENGSTALLCEERRVRGGRPRCRPIRARGAGWLRAKPLVRSACRAKIRRARLYRPHCMGAGSAEPPAAPGTRRCRPPPTCEIGLEPEPLRKLVAANVRAFAVLRYGEVDVRRISSESSWHRAQVYALLRARVSPSIDRLHAIARALGVDSAALVVAGCGTAELRASRESRTSPAVRASMLGG
jgi:hypothetical protein